MKWCYWVICLRKYVVLIVAKKLKLNSALQTISEYWAFSILTRNCLILNFCVNVIMFHKNVIPFMLTIIKLVIWNPTIKLSLSYITYYSYISPYKLVLLLKPRDFQWATAVYTGKVTWFQKQNKFIRGNINGCCS